MHFKLGQKIIDKIRGKKPLLCVPTFTNFLNKRICKNIGYVSFGDKNPDKVFFLIYRPDSAGMFSNIRWILRYLAVVDGTDLIPVLDDINFKSYYSEKEKINGTYSWWNYYFKPISEYSLEEVYNSKHVFVCNGEYVGGFAHYKEDNEVTNKEIDIYSKYFRFNDFFQNELNSEERYKNMMEFLKTPTLGIQFRGSDMIYERKHLTPMTIKQALKHTDECLKKENLSQIYLATESEEYKDAFVNYYAKKGIKVLCNNQTFGGVEKIIEELQNSGASSEGGYLSGKDVLLDLIGLTHCKALIGVPTNVLICADFMTRNKGVNKYFIDNGYNFMSITLNKLRWSIVSKLPASHFLLRMFGIKDRVRVE